MNSTRNPALAAGGVAGGLALLGVGYIGATHGSFDGSLETTVEYLNDSFLVLGLLGMICGLLALRAAQGEPRHATLMAVVGMSLLVAGVGAGLALGEDPGWFAALGGPGNLLWLIATIRIGVFMWRGDAFPRGAAGLMALTVPVGIVGGEFGGSAVIGLLWLYLGTRLLGADRQPLPARA